MFNLYDHHQSDKSFAMSESVPNQILRMPHSLPSLKALADKNDLLLKKLINRCIVAYITRFQVYNTVIGHFKIH